MPGELLFYGGTILPMTSPQDRAEALVVRRGVSARPEPRIL